VTRSNVPCPRCGRKTLVLRSVKDGGDYCSYVGDKKRGYKPCRWREPVRVTRAIMAGRRVR